MIKHILRFSAVIIATAVLLCGCRNIVPQIEAGVTPPPTEEPVIFTPEPTKAEPEPDKTSETAVTPAPVENIDALGNQIMTSDHYTRYISFSNVRVFEENGETLVDLTVTNSYPQLLLCAVNIEFYNEMGEIIAAGSLQAPDGSFLLALESGDTPLYARILTDTVLTDKVFKLTFDPQTGVVPQ